jgi:ubiquinone/menaquinone biosynthesis C-methylase UbiE
MTHPMLPTPTHDERTAQLFMRDLKSFMKAEFDPFRAAMTAALEARLRDEGPDESHLTMLRERLFEEEAFRSSITFQRATQEMLWETIGESLDRQLDDLNDRARIAAPRGSLRLDPALAIPDYVLARDTHLMPGGFAADEGDIRQGALMDRGGVVYMMGRNGRNGGLLNDGRGHSVVAHLYEFFPDLRPRRILELGCGVGNTSVAVAGYFPEAEFLACDVGASLLRYAHARAEHLGTPIHFVQANAEATGLPAESFDLVYTTVVFHEVSAAAIQNILGEMHRLLAPGGVAVNLDVAGRYEELSTWQRISGTLDMSFNNEYGWLNAVRANLHDLYRKAGFPSARVGYQPPVARAERGVAGFHETGYRGPGGSWYLSSAEKASSAEKGSSTAKV